jgi:hypothetical protein
MAQLAGHRQHLESLAGIEAGGRIGAAEKRAAGTIGAAEARGEAGIEREKLKGGFKLDEAAAEITAQRDADIAQGKYVNTEEWEADKMRGLADERNLARQQGDIAMELETYRQEEALNRAKVGAAAKLTTTQAELTKGKEGAAIAQAGKEELLAAPGAPRSVQEQIDDLANRYDKLQAIAENTNEAGIPINPDTGKPMTRTEALDLTEGIRAARNQRKKLLQQQATSGG